MLATPHCTIAAVDKLHTWVINLDRAPQRLARIGVRLDALGLSWTRFSAVEGKLVPPGEQAALLDRAGFERLHGMTPSLGELGCYLSHVRVMQAFLAGPHEFALILEDDVRPTAALPEVLQRLVAARERWDMVKLSAIHSGSPGSSAYLVNRAAAQRYAEQLLPMQLPYDHAYDRGWVYGLKVRRVFPEVCVHDDQVESTIGNPGPSRKFVWWRRWGTYGHRLRTELARLGYGLGQLLMHR
jgi:glycosyl transferase family 25